MAWYKHRQLQKKSQPPQTTCPVLLRSSQCRLHHTCCTLQGLHLTLQWPIAYPGLVTYSRAGLCALWLLSGASTSSGYPALKQTAPPRNHLPSTATAPSTGSNTPAADFRGCILPLVTHGMPELVTTRTLAGLCALWLPRGASTSGNKLLQSAKLQPPSTTYPARPPQRPVQGPQHLLHTVEAAFELALIHVMSRAGYSHTSRALCPVVVEQRLHICKSLASAKPHPPQTTCLTWPQHPV